jgi:hypothetical protein
MQKEGNLKAAELQKAEHVSQRRSLVLKILAVIITAAALVWGLVFAVSAIMDRSGEEVLTASNTDESAWTLPDSNENLIVKKFYRSLSGIAKMSGVRNKLLDGYISYNNGPKEEFYCIENGGQTYIRIGDTDILSAFFINSDGKGKKLLTTSHIGEFEPVDKVQGEALVNAVLYDELLWRATFSKAASSRQPFTDLGPKRIDDVVYEQIVIKSGEGLSDVFCFDLVTNLLMYRLIERNGMKIRVEYSNFKEFDGGYTYPAVRKVFIDDMLMGTCDVKRIGVNRDVMFPR